MEANDGYSDPLPTLEVTYRAVINRKFAIQPDLQFVFNPGADSTRKNSLVAGLRLEISF